MVSNDERNERKRWALPRLLPADEVLRARVIRGVADGAGYREIEMRRHTSSTAISYRRKHFALRFANIQRDGIDRGVFILFTGLSGKFQRSIRSCGKSARLICWTSLEPQRRTRMNPEIGTGC